MVHLNILFCFLIVTIGSAVVYQGIQTYRVYRFPAVRSFVLYIALYDLVTLLTLIAQYLTRNVSSMSADAMFVIVMVVMGSIGFTLAAVDEYMLASTVWRLSGKQRRPTWFVYAYGFLCTLWLAGFSVGCYRYFQLADGSFLSHVHSRITMSLVALDFLLPSLLLVNLRHVQPDRQRQIASSFGFFLISLACVEIGTYFLPSSLQFLSFMMVGLAMNVCVFIYFGRMVVAYYGATGLSPDPDLSLDWICAEFSLSARERDVVQRILKGKSNKEIEQELFISSHTVKNHIYHIFQKAGVKSRGQLVSMVMQHSAEPAKER